MRKRIALGLLALLLLGGGISSAKTPNPNPKPGRHFSPWLAHDAFESWLAANLKDKPFYITAAQGRLHHDVSEWRVRWVPSPKHVQWYWYWWYDSSADYYTAHVRSLVPEGFDQIWLQSFVNEKGERKYQSIFLKIIRPGAPKAPVPSSPPALAAPAPEVQPPATQETVPAVTVPSTPTEPLPNFD